jgi:hypothetical protein
MLLVMPLAGLIIGYATGEVRKALIATAGLFAAILVVVLIVDSGWDVEDGGAFLLAADLAVSLGTAWLGAALRARRLERGTSS